MGRRTISTAIRNGVESMGRRVETERYGRKRATGHHVDEHSKVDPDCDVELVDRDQDVHVVLVDLR